MRYNISKLADVIRKAAEAAKQFENEDDGGTCNFDSAYIRAPYFQKSQIKVLEEKSGVSLSLDDHGFHGRRITLECYSGQGARRTKMAEEACASLKSQGIDAGMFYMMD